MIVTAPAATADVAAVRAGSSGRVGLRQKLAGDAVGRAVGPSEQAP